MNIDEVEKHLSEIQGHFQHFNGSLTDFLNDHLMYLRTKKLSNLDIFTVFSIGLFHAIEHLVEDPGSPVTKEHLLVLFKSFLNMEEKKDHA